MLWNLIPEAKEAMLKQQTKEKEKLTTFRTDVCNYLVSETTILTYSILTLSVILFRFRSKLMTSKSTKLERN